MSDVTYPECEKWAKVHSDASAILQFMEWRDYRMHGNGPVPTTEMLVYEYFNIDPKKLEAERRAMLEAIR